MFRKTIVIPATLFVCSLLLMTTQALRHQQPFLHRHEIDAPAVEGISEVLH